MNVPHTIWFNVGAGSSRRRLYNAVMQALFHPNVVSRHVARMILKRRVLSLIHRNRMKRVKP